MANLITSFDIETTVDRNGSPMPYNGENKLVTAAYTTNDGRKAVFNFGHPGAPVDPEDHKRLQAILNETKVLVGHNLKFDLIWLRECGFNYSGDVYDTQIYEYLASRHLSKMPSLADSVARLNVAPKMDTLDHYFDKGFNTDEIPWEELSVYNLNDTQITLELFEAQLKEYGEDDLIKGSRPTLKMMNEFLGVLADMERTGISIDVAALDEVEKQFKEEQQQLERKLYQITSEVMGDTPINLNSNDHLSWILFSRKVKDKKRWQEIFNLGSEWRGGVQKPKRKKYHTENAFRKVIKEHTEVLYRTDSKHCGTCNGTGEIFTLTKSGVPFKRMPKCKVCNGSGTIYVSNGRVAGLKLRPPSYRFAATAGFTTNKETIAWFCEQPNLPDKAREFLGALNRYNAVSSYLSTFVGGIRNNLVAGDMLHTSFNQTSTVTGRLSSTSPNLQNFPREKTFPIRKVFKSRWENGEMIDIDFSTLEFIAAGLVSGDAQIFEDISNKLDVHTRSAKMITEAGQPTDRQGGKKFTFAPLYGSSFGTPAEMTYYKWFREHYAGVVKYQDGLADFAVANKYMVSPSGRVYGFPNIKRLPDGKVNQFTQICNYNVQGFATGDIVPATIIELYKLMQKHNLKSHLVLTVHDSVTIDRHPDDSREMIIKIVREAFDMVPEILLTRYNIVSPLKFGYEIDAGTNLLNKERIA